VTRITPHFTLEELTFSNTAVRLDINNTPDEEALKNLKTLAEGLEHVRTKLDGNAIRISSGYRSLQLNRALRSKDTSFHVRGLAADWTCPGFGSIDDVMRCIAESGIEWDQLIYEYGSWIHIAFPAEGEMARRQTFAITKDGVRAYE